MKSVTLVLALFLASLAWGDPEACAEKHLGRSYTPCVNNKRDAVFYWKQPCTPSDFPLPSSKIGLPCDAECDAGTYLPFGETQCANCNKGEYSLGGGEIIGAPWSSLPSQMKTDCTGEGCEAWQVKDSFIYSGNNTKHLITSNLRLYAHFIRPEGNKIRFSFVVDSESCANCDGLTFYIDDEKKTNLTSRELRWTTLEFDLEPGIHAFTWTYSKDLSVSGGQDMAFIRYIELLGTSYAPDTCSPCPEGTFNSVEGSPKCTPCGYEMYNNKLGQEACSPCGQNETSYQGAFSCTPIPPCEQRHIFASRTPCDTATKTQDIVYQYVTLAGGQIKVCNKHAAGAAQLPAKQEGVPCTCPPGQVLNSQGACVFCPEGKARADNQTECTQCKAGTAAMKSLYYSDWSRLPAGVTTFCQGECDSQGWVPRGEHLDTGYGSGKRLESFLVMDKFTILEHGFVETKYSKALCGYKDCDLEILIEKTGDSSDNDYYYRTALNYGEGLVHKIALDAGEFTVTWKYFQSRAVTGDSTKVKIYRIIVSGVSDGGASACVPCPAGSQSKEDGAIFCNLCQPGFYNSDEGSTCKSAGDGFFTNKEGSVRAIPCGANTESNEDHTDCVTDCTFTPPGSSTSTVKFDLNPLYNPEVMNFAGTDSGKHQYFLNMCKREHLNNTCYDAEGAPIPTFACQEVEGWGHAADLGFVQGFLPLPEGTNFTGLIVTFTEGTLGCKGAYGDEVHRASNVTMICDVNAGIGTPKPGLPNNQVEERIGARGSCRYQFVWRSLYACPVCTVEDYKLTISDCVGGKKVKTHVKTRDCWDPKPPAPEELTCKACPTDEEGEICGGSRGSCDDLTGNCNCEARWEGETCSFCAPGYFGEGCSKECPGGASTPCRNHGTCSSGVEGTGKCECSTAFTGESCDECAHGFEGESCTPLPASVTDVVPWWGFVLIFGGLAAIVLAVFVLWRQKRSAEYKYTSLLRTQPLEMDGDNVVEFPADLSDDEPGRP